MAKGIRKNVTIPGLLATVLPSRIGEFGFRTLSPFVVNLAAYDIQRGARHTISVAIGHDSQAAQDAVDAVIVARYQPGAPRDEGLLVQLVKDVEKARRMAHQAVPAEALNAVPERVTFPARIWKLVDARWPELGYECLSGYVTGLIRYNLMLGGTFRPLMPTPQQSTQRALARETVKRRKRREARRTYLDHLIERTEGRTLNDAELEKIKTKLARHLRTLVLTANQASRPRSAP